MSDPRIPQNGATRWGGSDPRQGAQPYPEPAGSPAHPQSPYAEQYPGQPYPGQHAAQHAADTGQHRVPADEAYPPARHRLPGKPLPEPPAGLAVGAIVAACCLLFVELAELAILLVTDGRGEAAAGFGFSPRFDPNSDTITILFGLAAYVATCIWLQAGRRFAEAADPTARFAHGRVWTWLAWWVPVVFLWFPYQVVRDIRTAVVPDDDRRVSLGLWWFFALLAGLRLIAPSSGEAEVAVRSIAVVALTLAFAHWIRMIREITRAQEQAAGLG
ncbi:DUF4328 domain-containing protein [Promicromonospora panici]|uniref:DUF4328 domain-containing protein n=1 Tax=Promicromonospora panici TaxID=2219658 RepID=UPI00101DDD15|nr:DUF4328 domain-containing protein [Promicromonospora panici]